MPADPSALAASLRSLVAAYCHRPAVRHELGLAEGTPLEATLLAQSPYNLTYLIQAPDGRRWVTRLSIGSPLGLSSSKQIAYEARALRFLEPFHIAPQLCYVDATLYHLPYGFLVMEYLPGEPLDPSNPSHLLQAARLLARLHSIPIPSDTEFMRNTHPLSMLVEDAAQFQSAYRASPIAQPEVVELLQAVLAAARAALINEPRFLPDTLVHNGLQPDSWIVAPSRPALLPLAGLQPVGSAHPLLRLVDWTQPLLDDPTNDLCRFLVAIPTHLHPDASFTPPQQASFLAAYLHARPHLDRADLRDLVTLRLRFVYLHAFSLYAPLPRPNELLAMVLPIASLLPHHISIPTGCARFLATGSNPKSNPKWPLSPLARALNHCALAQALVQSPSSYAGRMAGKCFESTFVLKGSNAPMGMWFAHCTCGYAPTYAKS